MNFKSETNFTYTQSFFKIVGRTIKLGGFGFGLPVPIEALQKRKPIIEGDRYVWKFKYRGALYEIFTPLDNVIAE